MKGSVVGLTKWPQAGKFKSRSYIPGEENHAVESPGSSYYTQRALTPDSKDKPTKAGLYHA